MMGQGFRGNCDSQGKLGMCPSLAEPDSDGFPRSNFEMFPVKHFVATVPPEQLQDIRLLLRFHKAGRSCSPRLEKLSLFSPPAPCAKRMAQGFRCLRAAIRAARPHLGSIFEKLLHRKTFYFACDSYLTTHLEKIFQETFHKLQFLSTPQPNPTFHNSLFFSG